MSLPKSRMARTVRPDDFFDEALMKAELTTNLPVRIIYIALHTMADREGRFAWNTQTVRYLSLDEPEVIQAVLTVLHSINKISKYHVNGEDYGVINAFTRTQHINPREKQSTLPAIKTSNMVQPDQTAVVSTYKPKAPVINDEVEAEAVDTENEIAVSNKTKKDVDITEFAGYTFKRVPKCGIWRYGDGSDIPVMVSTAEDTSDVVTVIDVIGGTVKQLGISEMKVREYDEIYPNADNIARVKKAAQWCRENEAKRKTHAGILRFLNSWVSSAQNNGEFLLTGTGLTAAPISSGFRGKVNPDQKAEDTARAFGSLIKRPVINMATQEKEVRAV
ncbi:MAG: hypothetical protein CTY35_00120 [Methylotenera sp.]|uniref:hypothetical protein n=1 Tax=Methylotenera sp. TaxID=2051956 RepID=UPI000D4F70E1|nr:hypothetical protein [Methylotenera sp.]PPC84761.1 MAG: hypothetical protein CTY38_00120 [Methylotenera sp.]PPD02120.1 MAG: hypothetical protein CTY35_00120 [Methylotenera sp.]